MSIQLKEVLLTLHTFMFLMETLKCFNTIGIQFDLRMNDYVLNKYMSQKLLKYFTCPKFGEIIIVNS